MATEWVDFNALRRQLSFQQVLQHYKVEVKSKGGRQHHGYCPLPNHNGKKNSPSFSANLERGIFHCFGCQQRGNLLDFAVLMDGGSKDNMADVRKTALALQERFGLGKNPQPKPKPPPPRTHGSVIVNARLDFELKRLDYAHPYLRSRKFTDETIKEFGLGFCSKGYQAGRIAIPLHDQLGRLIGYAGRIVDDELIDENNPRYRFPTMREHKGVIFEFRKTEFMYGGCRIKEPLDDLIVVEGFPSVWWLWQQGIRNVEALMGSSCSEKQMQVIVSHTRPNGRVWLITDGDNAGDLCAASTLPQVSRHRFVRWVRLDEGKQPTDYDGDGFRAFLKP